MVMTTRYRLHYAPDNASLVIRLALEELGIPYETILVDRRAEAQNGAEYRALNPNGLIPVLETPDGPMFETAAILLWLADRYGALAPPVASDQRGGFLKWLFFASNTLHADMRMLFYPEKYIGPDRPQQLQLRQMQRQRLQVHLSNLDEAVADNSCWLGGVDLSILDIYLACQLRWMALYPKESDRSWFKLTNHPHLHSLCARLELRGSVKIARGVEGLGTTPFTNPTPANPPEGSAT